MERALNMPKKRLIGRMQRLFSIQRQRLPKTALALADFEARFISALRLIRQFYIKRIYDICFIFFVCLKEKSLTGHPKIVPFKIIQVL